MRYLCTQKSLQCPNSLSLHDCSFSLTASSGAEMDTTLDMLALRNWLMYNIGIQLLRGNLTVRDAAHNENETCLSLSTVHCSGGSCVFFFPLAVCKWQRGGGWAGWRRAELVNWWASLTVTYWFFYKHEWVCSQVHSLVIYSVWKWKGNAGVRD